MNPGKPTADIYHCQKVLFLIKGKSFLRAPQVYMNNTKGELARETLVGKENLICLAKGQTVQLFSISSSCLFCSRFKFFVT